MQLSSSEGCLQTRDFVVGCIGIRLRDKQIYKTDHKLDIIDTLTVTLSLAAVNSDRWPDRRESSGQEK